MRERIGVVEEALVAGESFVEAERRPGMEAERFPEVGLS